MASTLQCPTCGLSLSDGHTTCPYDGTPLSPGSTRPQAAAPSAAGEVTTRRPVPPRASGQKAALPAAAPLPGGFEPTVRRVPQAEAGAVEPTVIRRGIEQRPRPSAAPTRDGANPFSAPDPTVRRDRDHIAPRTLADGSGLEAAPESDATARRDPLIGLKLGEYVVREQIGVGGMGLVYRGEQPVIGKTVAIKILRPDVVDNPLHMERLLSEARAVNAIRHRGIIDIFSFGQTPDSRQYFVMEFLDGTALDAYIAERGVLVPQEALGICEEILAALAAAHDAGVIHRDLKPNNIFLVRQPGGGTYVKVLDFGLAKRDGAAAAGTPQTQSGLIIGTPEYMAPEQIRAEPVSAKTDLYSFGIVAFQMLTGQLPFTANSAAEYLVRHLGSTPPAPIEYQADLPRDLSDLVLALLAKEPKDRPAMAEVRASLKRISRALPKEASRMVPFPEAPVPAAPPPPAIVVAPRDTVLQAKAAEADVAAAVEGRRRGGLALIGLAVAAALGLGAFAALRSPSTTPASTPNTPKPVEASLATTRAPEPVPTPAPTPAPVTGVGTAVAPATGNEAPPPEVPPTPPVATPTVVVASDESPRAAPVKSALSERKAKLLTRIHKLEEQLQRKSLDGVEERKARNSLAKLNAQGESATTSEALKQIAGWLDIWENSYLPAQ